MTHWALECNENTHTYTGALSQQKEIKGQVDWHFNGKEVEKMSIQMYRYKMMMKKKKK